MEKFAVIDAAKWFWLAGLTLAAWYDRKEKSIPLWIPVIWSAAGILSGSAGMNGGGGLRVLPALSVGGVLVFLSFLTGGALGLGDGYFFLMSAFYWEWQELLLLLGGSLGISCLWGTFLLLRRHKNRGDCWKETIPFLCCVWPVGVCLLWG